MNPIQGPAIVRFGTTEGYVVLRGELDASLARKLHEQLAWVLGSALPLVIETSATTFVAPQIWQLLYSFKAIATARGISVRFVSATWDLLEDLKTMGKPLAGVATDSVWPDASRTVGMVRTQY